MGQCEVRTIAAYLDDYLRTADIPDSGGAVNGLQVESDGPVRKIGAAVDASLRAIEEAISRGCDLLLVHHGLFWDGTHPVTGRRYRKLKRLIEANVAVYSSHIPLDLHPEVGNNVLLARALGVEVRGGFGAYKGTSIGVWGELNLKREALAARMDELLGGRVRMVAGGPEVVRRVAIVTGSASELISQAVAEGFDAFVSGEGPHHSSIDAMEFGINVYYGGHYATETFGVKALAAHVAERFGLEWEFLELPTGF